MMSSFDLQEMFDSCLKISKSKWFHNQRPLPQSHQLRGVSKEGAL